MDRLRRLLRRLFGGMSESPPSPARPRGVPQREPEAPPEASASETPAQRRIFPEQFADRASAPAGCAYASDWEYLRDELSLIDLLVQRALCDLGRQRGSRSQVWNSLAGLVISPEDINELVAAPRDLTAASQDVHRRAGELEKAAASLGRTIAARRVVNERLGPDLGVARLSRLFQLTRTEEQVMLVCLAPEIDRKYDKLFGYLHDDVTERRPSVGLALDLLCSSPQERLAARRLFDPRARLLSFGVISVGGDLPDGGRPLLARSLKLDERIVEFALGNAWFDGRLERSATLLDPFQENLCGDDLGQDVAAQLCEFVRRYFESGSARNLIYHICGPEGVGKHRLAACAARELGLPLLVCDSKALLRETVPLEALRRLAREALLQPAVLCLEGFELLQTEDGSNPVALREVLDTLARFCRMSFLSSRRAWQGSCRPENACFVALELSAPSIEERSAIWDAGLIAGTAGEEIDTGTLAGQFRFTSGKIRQALAGARDLALWRCPEDPRLTKTDVYAACRALSPLKLGERARQIAPKHRLDDLVLPDEQRAQLLEICQQAAHRHIVLGRWGFSRKLSSGKGLNVLFSGPPGTGKTMAAEILANHLQLDLYKIDLAHVVSKYIGETEKNLDQIFTAAHASNAILFFDEADALFGKRSEVSDAHDRYANIEIAYLLQKMEDYEGISILATNLKKNLDEAFLRRLQFIVDFPFPDVQNRRRLWMRMFPQEAPRERSIDFDWLAARFPLAGGSIQNVVINASFLAAGNGGLIGMKHLMRATRSELKKLGRAINDSDFCLPVAPSATEPNVEPRV